MRLTGFGAIACAALLATACGGDARDDRGMDNERPVGTSGVAGDDSTIGDRDDGDVEEGSDVSARIGAGVDAYQRTGTAQPHGATGDARHFVQTAAEGGHAEVELGRLAVERAQSADVKAFAQMMIRDHSKSNEELKQMASRQNVDVPATLSAKHQQLMTKLRTLRGAEFDRAYMQAMREGHKEMTSLLEHRADGSRTARDNRTGATGTSGSAGSTQLDSAVNQWASKALPTVEQHLQRAEQIHAKLESGSANASGDHADQKH